MREITLPRGFLALVDDGDYESLSAFGWWLQPSFGGQGRVLGHYAKARVGTKLTLMHRLVVGAKPGEVVDHIDKNGLNNTRANLRICTLSQNSAASTQVLGVSGFRGVQADKRGWRARIEIVGKRTHLGFFKNPADAARAYDIAAAAAFGPFASLNFPREAA